MPRLHRPSSSVAGRCAGLLAAGLGLTAGRCEAASAPTLYYERVLMDAAGGRCNLFAPNVRASLLASAAQARASAAAAGATGAQLDATQARAVAKADAEPCDAPELRIAAQRVRAAFLVWSHEADLVLPGRRSLWRAHRWRPHHGRAWALWERTTLQDAPATLGIVVGERADAPLDLIAAVGTAPAQGAYAARLVMRDPARAPAPYLSAAGNLPAGASQSFVAAARSPADPSLVPAGGVVFRLPAAATAAMTALDGRESVRLDLVYSAPGGDRVISTRFEVGDFATGWAFLQAGR